MPAQKLKQYLDSNGIKYVVITHSPAYTSQQVAASAHISGKKIAKTTIVKIDGKLAMAVLPAHEKVSLDAIKEFTGAQAVSLATEDEFKDLFPNCEPGTMPPFGNLYGMEVYASRDLSKGRLAFPAGNYRELIELSYGDYERIVKPRVMKIAVLV